MLPSLCGDGNSLGCLALCLPWPTEGEEKSLTSTVVGLGLGGVSTLVGLEVGGAVWELEGGGY